MKLRQTFSRPINGYWDYGPKQVFDWEIEGQPNTDDKGQYIKVGSWRANHYFHVALGKTIKKTLSNAKRRLTAMARRAGEPCKFEYVA
jgi:hypothetical protein